MPFCQAGIFPPGCIYGKLFFARACISCYIPIVLVQKNEMCRIFSMSRITADDVAELAGVSRSAVSRAFSKSASISRKTREKVLAASQQLGYQPNGLASNLAKRQSNIVAIVASNTPDLREPYFYQALNCALQAIGKVPIMISVDDDDTGETSLKHSIKFPLDTAIVLADSVEAAHVVPFCLGSPPIMLNDNFRNRDMVDAIKLDERAGITEMTRYLEQLGCKTIWFVAGRQTARAFNSRRIALLEAIACSEMILVDQDEGDFSYESGALAFKALFERGPLPDALFCANDAMAMGAMDAARFHHGVSIPDDLRVVGFDNIPQASWPSYNLTTIEQAIDETVRQILDILIHRSGDKNDKRTTYSIQTKLIIRSS